MNYLVICLFTCACVVYLLIDVGCDVRLHTNYIDKDNKRNESEKKNQWHFTTIGIGLSKREHKFIFRWTIKIIMNNEEAHKEWTERER